MAKTKNEQQPHSFKRKLGNTTYTVKIHFSKDTDKTFKDRVQKLIINEFLEKIRNNPSPHQWLSLIILLTVRVQKQIKIVKCSMKGGIL